MVERFNVVVFFADGGQPVKYRGVTHLTFLMLWIEKNLQGGNSWTYANLYDYRSGNYVRRVYRNNFYGN